MLIMKSHMNIIQSFIGEELVDVTRRLFPLSKQRYTFIAGLSMGGYGAITNGLKYYKTFGCIAALSSALLIDSLPKDGDDIPYLNKRSYLESVFGDLDQVKGSDKDYEALLLKVNQKEMPKIYMACGKDDRLLQVNRDFRDYLKNHQVDVLYEEGEGKHEWDFWDRYIYRVLEWLPLNDKEEGISSGNVGV